MEALTCIHLGIGDSGEGAGQVFTGKGSVLDPQGSGMCGHTQEDVMVMCGHTQEDVMVMCGHTDDERWLPQPTGGLQNSDPSTHPQQRAKGCVTARLTVRHSSPWSLMGFSLWYAVP